MKELPLTVDVYNNVLHLLEGYKDRNMPPVDYLQFNAKQFLSKVEECDSVLETFLLVVQRRELLLDITNYFYCLGKRKDQSDENSLVPQYQYSDDGSGFFLVLNHLLISVLSRANMPAMIQVLNRHKLEKVVHLLKMLNKKSFLGEIFQAGCQYFAEDYVLENFVLKMKENKNLLQELLSHYEQLSSGKEADLWRPPTKPVTPNITVSHRVPPPPNNTPQEFKPPPAKPVPESTHKDPTKLQEALKFLKELHHNESMDLLSIANKSTERLMSGARPKHCCQTDSLDQGATSRTRFRKAKPIMSEAPVKKNAATILREAARVIKEEEKEIQKVNALLRGAADHSKYDEMLGQARIREEQNKLADIERKHLQGLLSREEAILAKQVALERKKLKKAQFDLEKKETEEILKKMRQEHEEKLKDIIEATQNIQKRIEEKKRNLMSEKQRNAQQVADTSKQLYEEAISKQKEELEKRIELIKEIKALSSIKDFNSDKFDPTETMNMGLLSEMSLAELQERLQLNKASLKEEMECRQKCIRKQRQKQQQFIKETEKFVETCRQQKEKINKIREEKLTLSGIKDLQNQDILELRGKLQNARRKRMELKN